MYGTVFFENAIKKKNKKTADWILAGWLNHRLDTFWKYSMYNWSIQYTQDQYGAKATADYRIITARNWHAQISTSLLIQQQKYERFLGGPLHI